MPISPARVLLGRVSPAVIGLYHCTKDGRQEVVRFCHYTMPHWNQKLEAGTLRAFCNMDTTQ